MMVEINIPKAEKRVVIVGAGFAGLELAKRLSNSTFQVVLIDKNNYHQFQPLLYQVATAGLEPSSIVFPLRKMFQKAQNVFIRVTSVDEVKSTEKIIVTPLGSLSYDYLVIATGASTNYYGNENISQNTIPMKSVSEALYLRNHIFEDYESALTSADADVRQSFSDIVIVGGGPTGVELAGALAEMKAYILPKDYREMNIKDVDIYLIQSADILLKGMSAEAADAAEQFLLKRGVIIKKNTRVLDYDGETVKMNDGTSIRTKKVIWAAGITPNIINGLAAESYANGNRLVTNAQHQVQGYQDIYAIGDNALLTETAFPTGHPQVAQVAIQMAKNLAKNLVNSSKNKANTDFEYNDLGSMATIGRNQAVVDLPKFKFQGFFAWIVWLFVHLFAIVGVKNKIFVFLNWVWNYFTYDQSLRLIIKPFVPKRK